MALITTSTLPNADAVRLTQRYQRAATTRRLYDQYAVSVSAPQFVLEELRGLGTSYIFNFASDMEPGTNSISETSDIVPQIIQDATASLTPTSLGEALKWSKLVDISAYTDFVAFRAEKIGENAMESIEVLATAAALQGSLVVRGAARDSLDANTSAHLFTDKYFWTAATMVKDLKCPPFMDKGRQMFVATVHPDAYFDLFSGGNIVSAAQYQDINILLNGEVGEIAEFKIVSSPWAKFFGAAGSEHGTAAAYTLSSASTALDKTLSIGTATNVASGRLLTVGTEETGNTFHPLNERVRHVSGTTTSVIVGSGANGGMRFGHDNGTAVRNADSVYPVVYGTKGSLVKVFAEETGPFGEMVGPQYDGIANQWQSLAWIYFGQYGRVAENYILRGEYASSLDAT